MPLPPSFKFGVATSGFQIEGGYNGRGQPANNWRDWEQQGRVPAAGPALDFWNEYESVLDRAVDAGCRTIRLSVEWARCEPTSGAYDDDAFDRYNQILDACHRRGLEPVVCLHHFTHPHWLGSDFWLDLRSPDRFAEWAAAATARLHDRCRHWLTINEINALAFQTWFTGGLPPGRLARTGDTVRATGHLLAAHVLAYRAVHGVQPDAVVATNNHSQSIYELDRLLIDALLARSHGVARHDLHDWLVDRRRAFHAALPPPSRMEQTMRTCAASMFPLDQALARAVAAVYDGPDDRPLDVIQVNYYNPVAGHRLRMPGRKTVGGRSWSPFRQIWDDPADPDGLLRYLGLNHEPGLDLWVAENGLCTRVKDGVTYPRHDGWDRVRYLNAATGALEAATAQGLPLTRYFHWTLGDNYEWGSYEHRFGLYRVDQTPHGPAWSDVDAFGGDAAAAYRQLVGR